MEKNIIINKKYENLRSSFFDIEKLFGNSSNIIHDARNQLKIIELDGNKFVIKSFKVPNLLKRIYYSFFHSSKAQKSYENALILEEKNIHTPEPVAYIELKSGGLVTQSYYISKLFEYDFTIREVFHHKVEDVENILKQFTHFTFELHKNGVWHEDYSLGNILIKKQEQKYIFSVVDINRMVFKNISAQEGLRNFSKFWEKFEGDLDIIAKEYANISSFDEAEAIKIVNAEAQKVINFKNRKKILKKIVGKE